MPPRDRDQGCSQSLQRFSAERVRGRYRRPTEASWSRADGSASAYTSPINPADRRFDRRCVVAGFKALSPLTPTTSTPTHPQHDSQPLTRLPATQIRWRVAQGSQEGGATRHRFKARVNPRPHTKHSLIKTSFLRIFDAFYGGMSRCYARVSPKKNNLLITVFMAHYCT